MNNNVSNSISPLELSDSTSYPQTLDMHVYNTLKKVFPDQPAVDNESEFSDTDKSYGQLTKNEISLVCSFFKCNYTILKDKFSYKGKPLPETWKEFSQLQFGVCKKTLQEVRDDIYANFSSENLAVPPVDYTSAERDEVADNAINDLQELDTIMNSLGCKQHFDIYKQRYGMAHIMLCVDQMLLQNITKDVALGMIGYLFKGIGKEIDKLYEVLVINPGSMGNILAGILHIWHEKDKYKKYISNMSETIAQMQYPWKFGAFINLNVSEPVNIIGLSWFVANILMNIDDAGRCANFFDNISNPTVRFDWPSLGNAGNKEAKHIGEIFATFINNGMEKERLSYLIDSHIIYTLWSIFSELRGEPSHTFWIKFFATAKNYHILLDLNKDLSVLGKASNGFTSTIPERLDNIIGEVGTDYIVNFIYFCGSIEDRDKLDYLLGKLGIDKLMQLLKHSGYDATELQYDYLGRYINTTDLSILQQDLEDIESLLQSLYNRWETPIDNIIGAGKKGS